VAWEVGGGGTLNFDVHIGGVSVAKDGQLMEDFRHFKFGSGTWQLDPTTLHEVGLVEHQRVPSALNKVEGSFPGLRVHWAGGGGGRDQAGLDYRLRWETLDANQDHPRTGALPPPSMLQLVTFKTPDATAHD
jgi:hypothetical protein